MAASFSRSLTAAARKFLPFLTVPKHVNGSKTRYTFRIINGKYETPVAISQRLLLEEAGKRFFSRQAPRTFSLFRNKAMLPAPRQMSSGFGGEEGNEDKTRRLRLMDFSEIIWPHILKSLRNRFFSFLIRGYFDTDYSGPGFMQGAEQAMQHVSQVISQGRFDDLEGLVSREAIREIRQNYQELTQKQRDFIAVDTKDLFFRFIYEIGMIFDDSTDQRFVEITTVFQGIHGFYDQKEQGEVEYSQEQVYVANYRFVREFTKGQDDSWTINKLNHFSPKEIVASSNIFRR